MNSLYNFNWIYANFRIDAHLIIIIILLDLNMKSTFDLDLSGNL